jgi:hypothetical protein
MKKNIDLITLIVLCLTAFFYEPLLWFIAIAFLILLPPSLDPAVRCKEWVNRK